MGRLSIIFIILFQVFSLIVASDVSAVIFGADNRVDVIRDGAKNRDLAPAIGMSVGRTYKIPQPNSELFSLDFLTATESPLVSLCEEEKFSGQYANWVNCTGFLVSENVMVTAGHCMIFNHSGLQPALVENGTTTMCRDFDWLFDFKANGKGRVPLTDYAHEQTGACAKIIHAEITGSAASNASEYGVDFAIIQLDRSFPKRQVLKFSETPVKNNDDVFAITHPSGLPLKLSHSARVLDNHYENFFTTTLDISSGSSGGPVFNAKNQVVGIVVRVSPGEDYVWDEKRKCSTSFVCKNPGKGDCTVEKLPGALVLGTHVQKINPIVKKLRELQIIK
jgi:V8-like Glu-specific endopeptidase